MSTIDHLVHRIFAGVDVESAVLRSGGQLSSVYEVQCVGRESPVIVKIYSEQWRWKQAKEVYVYGLLARHGVTAIPRILDAESDGHTVMTLVPGRPLREVAPVLSADQERGIHRQMGALLAQIHSIKLNAYGYITDHILEPQPTNYTYMTRQFTKKVDEFADLGGAPELICAINAHLDTRLDVFRDDIQPTLCHNDFHDGNVLVRRGQHDWAVSGFVDVENAIAADPVLDLAKTDYYSIRGDPNKLAGLLEGYGPVPPTWCDRLALYRLYHAIELWDWFASNGKTAPLQGITKDIESAVLN